MVAAVAAEVAGPPRAPCGRGWPEPLEGARTSGGCRKSKPNQHLLGLGPGEAALPTPRPHVWGFRPCGHVPTHRNPSGDEEAEAGAGHKTAKAARGWQQGHSWSGRTPHGTLTEVRGCC